MANEVKDGLRAVHRLLIAVAVTGAVGLIVCFPRLSDARQAGALRSLDGLAEELDVDALEATLQRQGERGAATSLQQVAVATEGRGVRKLAYADAQTTLFRAQPVSIQTLGEVVEQSAGEQPLKVVGPDIKQLGLGLRWRLGNRGGADGLKLSSLQLLAGSASEAQLSAEAQVEPLRLAAIDTRKDHQRARSRFEYRRDRTKALWKRKAPRKVQWRMHEKRREAFEDLQAAKLAMDSSMEQYRTRAEAALAFEPGPDDPAAPGVVLEASFEGEADGEPLKLRLPVPRVEQTLTSVAVPLPPHLSALRSQALWPELANQSLADARAAMRDGLSWQMWGRDLGGLRVGGASVLQLYPGLMLLLLWLLARKAHAVRNAYSPFNHPGSSLPAVGTGKAGLDAALLIGPVSLLVALDVWALLRIDAQWWIALLLGAAAVGYSVVVSSSVEELKELRSNILRTSLPPAPTQQAPSVGT